MEAGLTCSNRTRLSTNSARPITGGLDPSGANVLTSASRSAFTAGAGDPRFGVPFCLRGEWAAFERCEGVLLRPCEVLFRPCEVLLRCEGAELGPPCAVLLLGPPCAVFCPCDCEACDTWEGT